MTNFIFLTYDAVKELAAIHQFQSSDFKESVELCSAIRGDVENWTRLGINYIRSDKGGFFYTSRPDIKQGVIFDLSTFDGFSKSKDDQIITILQKVMKFSVRYYEKLPPTSCEKHLPGKDTSIVFPFPFVATKDSYRILIDRNPDSKRLEKRDKKYLLVYGSGQNEIFHLEPSYTNLKKAVEQASEICRVIDTNKTENNDTSLISSLKSTQLEKTKDLSITASIGYKSWQHYLTENQKSFINKSVRGPERLEGAAGTGKTLTMILRCINLIKKNYDSNNIFHIIFITHSTSTKNQILDIFRSNFEDIDLFLDKEYSPVSITVTTLQEWCIKFLGNNLGSTEYLDRDAQDSKELQRMYLEDAFTKSIVNDFESYKLFCSEEFINFIQSTKKEEIIEMLQHEVAVTIKGRANEDIERYKVLPRLKYSIPCRKEGDVNFLYLIYQQYQKALRLTNQFDSDDIILTALGQLNTPIWRRRREREGYDVSFIDETHLFNINELSIFHYLNKNDAKQNIVFTIDKSQAVGDRGLVDEALFDALGFNELQDDSSLRLNTIFRSSPDIVNLAFNVLSSGASLFTNFENPLNKVSFSFTKKEEEKTKIPKYILKESDERIIADSFSEAETLVKDLETSKSKILIISTTELLLNQLEQFARRANKPFEILKSRGDLETVKTAFSGNRFILAGIDFVGGLEFDGVIIIGVDKGRVPPTNSDSLLESTHFLNYAWHNRLYVAITRAKYALILIGDKSRGESKLLESSIENNIIEVIS